MSHRRWPRSRARIRPRPHIDYAAISPFEVLLGGAVVVLLVGLLRSRFAREQPRAVADPADTRRDSR